MYFLRTLSISNGEEMGFNLEKPNVVVENTSVVVISKFHGFMFFWTVRNFLLDWWSISKRKVECPPLKSSFPGFAVLLGRYKGSKYFEKDGTELAAGTLVAKCCTWLADCKDDSYHHLQLFFEIKIIQAIVSCLIFFVLFCHWCFCV